MFFNGNDFKYIIKKILIGVAIFFLIFSIKQCNVFALSQKQTIGTSPTFSPNSRNGSLNSGAWVGLDFPLSSNLTLDTQYDYIGIQLNNSEFVYSENVSLSGSVPTGYCDEYGYIDQVYVCPGGDCSSTVAFKEIICKHYTYPSGSATLNGTINNQGDVYHYYVLMTAPGGNLYPCHFSSDYEEVIFCPTKNNGNAITMTGLRFYISNKSYSTLNYYITLDNIKSYYNNDSTDILNGLNAINSTQTQTNTIIQDSDTSGASTDASTGLNSINSTISSNVDNIANVNTFNNIFTTFINQLDYTTCQAIELPYPFDSSKKLILPCIGNMLQTHIPILWTFWKVFCAGIMAILFWRRAIEFVKKIVDPYNLGASNLPIGGGK